MPRSTVCAAAVAAALLLATSGTAEAAYGGVYSDSSCSSGSEIASFNFDGSKPEACVGLSDDWGQSNYKSETTCYGSNSWTATVTKGGDGCDDLDNQMAMVKGSDEKACVKVEGSSEQGTVWMAVNCEGEW